MCFSIHIDKDIAKIAKLFDALPVTSEFQKLKEQEEKFENIKIPSEDGIVYPNYFAPILIKQNNKRYIRPMRYRVRPNGSEKEVPSKYNLFNARLDSLEKRKTWSQLFMHNHGLAPFKYFYEWVEDKNGVKQLIYFKPKDNDIMWAPCLWDFWQSPEDKNHHFFSFAIITTDPPAEVEAAGHDRCPLFLASDNIDSWLQPEGQEKKDIYELLKIKENVYYESENVGQV